MLVKPATVIQWHRQGFRLFWRWRSRSGRPSVEREIRDLIRQMSSANPLWGAPRIHGELLKLGIQVSQATVSSTWCEDELRLPRPGAPFCGITPKASRPSTSSSWRPHRFRLHYVTVIRAHDRRRIIHTAVTEHPTAGYRAG